MLIEIFSAVKSCLKICEKYIISTCHWFISGNIYKQHLNWDNFIKGFVHAVQYLLTMRVQKDRQWFLSSNLCASYSCGWLYYSVYYIHAHTHYHTHIQCLYNHVLALVVFFLIFQDDFLTFKHLWLLCSSDHQCRDLDWAFQHSLSLRLIVYSLFTPQLSPSQPVLLLIAIQIH